jgi:uncharacterized tellurite resistance protein B-like protein
MGFTIVDRDIDDEINKILRIMRDEFGIRNASKTDVIRYLLNMKKQGKKTDYRWKRLID